MPKTTQDAVIAAEDRTFYDNAGVDVKGIVRAAWNNLQGDSTQGASTITQQYVKIAYLSTEQTYTRKAKEAILALKIQQELSKEEILQGYLNTIYFGRGAYGVQAASQAYFGVDVEELKYDQSAFLAAVLNSPGNLDPAEGKQAKAAALERYQYVLDGMVDLGTLDQQQADAVYDRLPKTPVADTVQRLGGPKGYILTMVEDELNAEGFSDEEISGGGLQITTTFTKQDMQGVVQSVKEQKPDGLKDLHIGVASVEPGTGAVRAVYGGPDFLGEGKNAQVNWATAGAQPGSSFKPFALLAGLREGYSLYDTFNGNSPYYLPTGEDVENQGDSGGGSFGYVSLLTATQESINTAYVDLTVSMEDGPQKVLDSAVLAGIPREDLADVDPVPVVPLGFANVSAIDMANAYATFAAGGERADWFTVSSVTDSSGNELYDHKVQSEQVIDPDIAADITYALQQVVSTGTGTNASTITCPAAGKTGTATGPEGEVSSSWFVGFTPKLATSVTYLRGDGNDALDGYLPTFYGGEYPARTWAGAMEAETGDKDCGSFPEPAFVTGDPPTTAPPSTTVPPSTSSTTTQPPETTTTTTQTTAHVAAHDDDHRAADDDHDRAAADDRPPRVRRPRRRSPTPTRTAGEPDRVDRPVRPGRGEVVAPTWDDPFVAASSPVVGGVLGAHARPHPFWTPLRVVLVLVTLTAMVWLVRTAPCSGGAWWGEDRFSDLCYSDVPLGYVEQGHAERTVPYSDTQGRYPATTDTPPVAAVAYVAAVGAQWLSGSPDVDARSDLPLSQLNDSPALDQEATTYFYLAVLLLFGFALVTATADRADLGPKTVGRRRLRRGARAAAGRRHRLGPAGGGPRRGGVGRVDPLPPGARGGARRARGRDRGVAARAAGRRRPGRCAHRPGARGRPHRAGRRHRLDPGPAAGARAGAARVVGDGQPAARRPGGLRVAVGPGRRRRIRRRPRADGAVGARRWSRW